MRPQSDEKSSRMVLKLLRCKLIISTLVLLHHIHPNSYITVTVARVATKISLTLRCLRSFFQMMKRWRFMVWVVRWAKSALWSVDFAILLPGPWMMTTCILDDDDDDGGGGGGGDGWRSFCHVVSDMFFCIFRVALPRKSSRSSFRMAEDGHPKCTKLLSLSSTSVSGLATGMYLEKTPLGL